ncbi:MAG: acetylneuraminate ABC transporter [Pirellulaceae bacterium]|nr:MAG: acetylneuraminate ABC transporter [Pirellulaceae bacterium]
MAVEQSSLGGAVDYGIVAAYVLGMLVVGGWVARRQRSTEDFFVGSRRLPSWAVGISLLASMFSTITYLGLPGEMFRSGVGYLIREVGIVVTFVVVWFVLVPFYSRLRLTSAYEYLEHRFNYATRALASLLCCLLLMGWMAVAVVTASRALVEIMQWRLGWDPAGEAAQDSSIQSMILLIGGISLVYTTLGGLRAVVWTDVVQFAVMLFGAIYCLFFVAWSTDSTPLDWWHSWKSYPYRDATPWWSWDVGQRSSLSFIALGMTFWMLCTHGANQVALQRYFAVSDLRAARRTYLVNAVANLALVGLLAAVGYALFYLVWEVRAPLGKGIASDHLAERVAAQDSVFPQFIRIYVPPGMRGLVMAALLAAAMSTIDSGANSIATLVLTDLIVRRSTRYPARQLLRWARITTAVASFAIILFSLGLYHVSKTTDIITLCQKGFNCYLGPLGGLLCLALFCRKATSATAIPAVLVGVAAGVASAYSAELFGIDYSTHLVIPTAFFVTIAVGWCTSWLGGRPTRQQTQWTWWQVVRHGPPVEATSEGL